MSLFSELKRRNVFRVGLAYVVSAWLALQVTDVVLSILELPGWIGRLVFVIVALGFPVTLVLAWIYELTPEGIRRDQEARGDEAAARAAGRRLDFIIIGVLAVAVAYFAINHDWSAERRVGTASAPSIAVLPFVNRSALEEDVFFVDGMHDDLLTLLSKLGDLKVISRSSVEKFRGTALSIPDVAGQLGVATILEGAVQRAGGQVRITVQLIDADSDEHLWAESYDRELTAENIFAIQSDIARVIARSLQKILTPAEQSRVDAVPTRNFLAYEEFLRGSQKMVLREIPELRDAVVHFKKSIELDSDYAMAYAGLAKAYFLLTNYGDMSRPEATPLLEASLARALELDPQLGEAFAVYAQLLEYKGQMAEKVTALETAIELAPGYATAYHWLAEHWRDDSNDPVRALPLILEAQQLDPLSPTINISVAETLHDLGRADDALAQINNAIELAPDFPSAYAVKAQILAYSFGRVAEAVQVAGQGIELDPNSVFGMIGQAAFFSDLGDDDRAIERIEYVLELAPDFVWAHFTASGIYTTAGREEPALAHARSAQAVHAGLWWPLKVMRDADFDNGEALTAVARYERIFPGLGAKQDFVAYPTNIGASIDYAWLLNQLGQNARAREILQGVLELLPQLNRLGFRGYGIDDALAMAILGESERALDTLESAVTAGWRRGWRMALADRALDDIRDDPRFIAQQTILEADMASQLAEYRAGREDE